MKFFAVTETSVYEILDKIDKKTKIPVVKKIALKKGLKSAVLVGETLNNGHFIGVTNWIGITLYDEQYPEKGKREPPSNVNMRYFGGHTDPIIALFLNREEALACLNPKKPENWKEKTKEVLDTIGKNHPVIDITDFPMD